MADRKWYDEGTRPRIYINWDSFEDWGLPSDWKWPFAHAVINAYTRLMNVGGIDLRPQFYGFTKKTDSDTGELVISMNEKHGDSGRIASTFGGYNELIIVFHRKRGSDLSPWNFVPYNAEPGEIDMQAVLMHELGHCLGLDHTADSPTMMSGYTYFERFGPYDSDVKDLRGVYATFTDNRLRQIRSSDSGATWTVGDNNLTDHGAAGAHTNLSPGVTPTPGSGLYLVGWSRPGNAPTWLRGDGNHFLTRNWLFYGGQNSMHGPTYASDGRGTLLWAWVDNDDKGTIKVVRSTNHGFQWHWAASPEGATTYGTPALCWSQTPAGSTWILAWAHFDRSDRDATGHVRAAISTDDGASWSTPTAVNTFYRTLFGVSVAASPSNRVLISFAWAPSSAYDYGMNRIRTLDCEVQSEKLEQERTIYTTESTRIQPAMTYEPWSNTFIMAWRAQNFHTSLNVMKMGEDDKSWNSKTHLSEYRTHVAPSVASSPEMKETVVWYAHERA